MENNSLNDLRFYFQTCLQSERDLKKRLWKIKALMFFPCQPSTLALITHLKIASGKTAPMIVIPHSGLDQKDN